VVGWAVVLAFGRADLPRGTAARAPRGHTVGTIWAHFRRSLSNYVMVFSQLDGGLTP